LTGPWKRIDAGGTAAAFAVALAASLLFLHLYPASPPKNDAIVYYRIAQNVAGGKGFTIDGVQPYAGVPPLFCSLLGMWFRIAGDSVSSAAFFQSLAHASSAGVSYLLFRAMSCAPAFSLVLALAVALHPLLLTRVPFVLQEPTLLLFTTSALLATVVWLRGRTGRSAGAAGILWAIASLGKAVALFGLPLALLFRVAACGEEGRRAAVCQAILAGALFLAVLAPWTARNYAAFHRIFPISDQRGGAAYEWKVSGPATPETAGGGADAADSGRGGGTWDRRIVSLLRNANPLVGGFPVDRIARNAIDFTGPARDWWWARGRYGPGEAREWYWALHDIFHRFLFLVPLVLVFRTFTGKVPAPRAFVACFCLLYWIEYSLVLGIPRYAVPLYPALLALLIPSPGKRFAPTPGPGDAGRLGLEGP